MPGDCNTKGWIMVDIKTTSENQLLNTTRENKASINAYFNKIYFSRSDS